MYLVAIDPPYVVAQYAKSSKRTKVPYKVLRVRKWGKYVTILGRDKVSQWCLRTGEVRTISMVALDYARGNFLQTHHRERGNFGRVAPDGRHTMFGEADYFIYVTRAGTSRFELGYIPTGAEWSPSGKYLLIWNRMYLSIFDGRQVSRENFKTPDVGCSTDDSVLSGIISATLTSDDKYLLISDPDALHMFRFDTHKYVTFSRIRGGVVTATDHFALVGTELLDLFGEDVPRIRTQLPNVLSRLIDSYRSIKY